MSSYCSAGVLDCTAAGEAKKEWRNPFLPYDRALWVADLGGGWPRSLLGCMQPVVQGS